LQLGEPAYLAQELGVPVAANFRTADLAAGGQGAPLATLFHRVAFARATGSVAVQNLGGIANVTYLAPGQPVLSFDTGPANLLMDLAISRASSGLRRYDRNGSLARRGTVDPGLLELWMNDPFLRRQPPKSTGRERYGEAFLDGHDRGLSRLSLEDRLATLTEFTAASVALNHLIHLPQPAAEVILCGGGAANGWLVERLRHHLGSLGSTVLTCEARGWPRQSVEPAAFALLAAYRLWELPGSLPETTGASRPVRLGQV
jgi:anhydro-N-acetylmuramic acid kinase